MTDLLNIDELTMRMEIHIKEEVARKCLRKGSFELLREALCFGQFKRGRAAQLTGYSDRQARQVLSTLLSKGYLVSDTAKGEVRPGFLPLPESDGCPACFQSSVPVRQNATFAD